ncbi:MAG TPA: AmmeMemoRadiSam system protein A [Candidatus Acidoferrales bacterium]|nr:AmmeMemoRadiSam system protein A [Candidatus Acidoferrales bacterium]
MCPPRNQLLSSLRSEDKETLLALARNAISLMLTEGRLLEVIAPEGELAICRGAFVTLRKRQRLCGCIGRLSSLDSLAHVIAHSAVAAATEDPRFLGLRADELGEIEIEISVLSEPQTARANEVEAGLHGLAISRNGRRGVLLPQVAREHKWPRERFLQETCHKAGLAPSAWRDPETQIEIFTAETFSESDFFADHS